MREREYKREWDGEKRKRKCEGESENEKERRTNNHVVIIPWTTLNYDVY